MVRQAEAPVQTTRNNIYTSLDRINTQLRASIKQQGRWGYWLVSGEEIPRRGQEGDYRFISIGQIIPRRNDTDPFISPTSLTVHPFDKGVALLDSESHTGLRIGQEPDGRYSIKYIHPDTDNVQEVSDRYALGILLPLEALFAATEMNAKLQRGTNAPLADLLEAADKHIYRAVTEVRDRVAAANHEPKPLPLRAYRRRIE